MLLYLVGVLIFYAGVVLLLARATVYIRDRWYTKYLDKYRYIDKPKVQLEA